MLEGFLHPALAWGALLAAVPLLIHILNRQHHRPMEWAAMRFVLAAYRRTRRRAMLENLLLLLLRMAAVALFAFALARPFTGSTSPLAALTESRHELVLLVDDSASTGYGDGVKTVHERIRERALELLEDYRDDRGDRVRLFALGARPRLLSPRSPSEASAVLASWNEPRDEAMDLAAGLAEVASFAEGKGAGGESADATVLEIRLLTDLQRSSFEESATPAADAPTDPGMEEAPLGLAGALDRLAALELEVLVEDLGPARETPPNVGIDSIVPLHAGNPDGPLFALPPGLPTDLAVHVTNHGGTALPAVRVTLWVDGERKRTEPIGIEAGSGAEADFQVVFTSPGPHFVEARLEGDGLAVDDRRTTVLRVPDSIDVLLVDGDPHPEVDRDETGILSTILSPMDDGVLGADAGTAPFRSRVVDAALLATDPNLVRDSDAIVLANVASISPRVFEAIERRVRAGACLIITLGDRSSDASAIAALNARGWSPDGTGILPAKLLRAHQSPNRRDAYFRVTDFAEAHPALRFFTDERWRPLLTEVPIYAFVQTEPIEGARVLATLDDVARSPLLLEREFDRGRVFLWTSSIDRDWCRVADSPATLIPLVHELLRYGTRGRLPRLNVRVGDPITVEATSFPRDAVLVAPDAARRPVPNEAQEVAEGLWSITASPAAPRAGLWRVEWEGGGIPVAVGLDPAEGDLARIGARELSLSHDAWRIAEPAGDPGSGKDQAPKRGELWRTLAAAALLALVGETALAAWIGRSRRRA